MSDMTDTERMVYAIVCADRIKQGDSVASATAFASDTIGIMRDPGGEEQRPSPAVETKMPAGYPAPILDSATMIEAMIEARARLATHDTAPIDAGWCLYERQYKLISDAIIRVGGVETFRGEPIAVRNFGGYVFDRNTGSRTSIEGEW